MTGPVSPATAPEPGSIGATVGRYRLDRELGAGGMGVVHAAFDPDLQRRVALKVLRTGASSVEAKDRLLREARAMARLSHPNVVTVHEVGTASGRDYVAMELVLGETLADWLRSERRRPADIVAAFVAAGRGLAAAHAAGIVHRDFKPHNVLRSRNGRIVVTDFGLAREAQADLPSQLEATLPLSARVVAFASATPSSLTGITQTGSLLGTPAYMAPEQWGGGLVTPATDQYAYCVALWEALAGERPYPGPTLEELRNQAALGPDALDASKIPRRLRAVLRRGLNPDPAQRWPYMDALLARLVRAERRPGVALAIAVGAIAGAGALVVATRAGSHLSAPLCELAVLDPAQVWSPEVRAGLGGQTVAAAVFDRELAAWQDARAVACLASASSRAPRLLCLDGVIARLDAVVRGTRAHRDAGHVDAGALLIDPHVCELPRAPRLMTNTSPEFRDAVTTWLGRSATEEPLRAEHTTALIQRTAADPCASSLAHLLAADVEKSLAERSRHLDEAQQDAERCGDDRMLVETALATARYVMSNEWLSSAVTTKVRLADAAVHRVEQRDLQAEVELMRVEIAKRTERLDDAIASATAAMDGFAARGRLRAQIKAGLIAQSLRQIRATPDDLAAMSTTLTEWRSHAAAQLGESDPVVRAIDKKAAAWAWLQGDIAGADAVAERAQRALPNDRAQRITGVVVDDAGAPVAGAKVTAGWMMRGDSVRAAAGFGDVDAMRTAVSGPDGRFEIPDAAEDAVVIAELGDRRSRPMMSSTSTRLELAPTSRIEGRVDLAGMPASKVIIVVQDRSLPVPWRYAILAPVAADGGFAVEGVPRSEVRVFASRRGPNEVVVDGTSIKVRDPVVRGLALSVDRPTRVIHAVVRNIVNTKLANAQVVVTPGRVPTLSLLAIQRHLVVASRLARQLDEQAPKEVVAVARPGDLFATISDVPEGVASACALGLPELSDEDVDRKLMANLDKVQVTCVPLPESGSGNVVTIEVPPIPRLD